MVKLSGGDDLDRLIDDYVRELFDERNVSPAQRKKLWQHYNQTLSKGIDVGFSPDLKQYDPALAHSLKYNVAQFSAFKETSFKKQLEGLLTKNGDIKPWSEFKKDAFALSGDYNKRWLRTEYDHTVASANMAAKWKDWQASKDLYPNLKYVTVGDGRVRAKHQQWDGLILPIDHPWWKTHLPPQDWGCRCDGEPTDEDATVEIPGGSQKAEFANNAGESGKAFKENAYEKSMTATEVAEAKQRLDQYLDGESALIPTKHKGLKIHPAADMVDLPHNLDIGAQILDELEYDILIRQHISNKKGMTNPEFLFNGKFLGDVKTPVEFNLEMTFKGARKQMGNKVINPAQTPYIIILELNKIKDISNARLINEIQRRVTTKTGKLVLKIIIVESDIVYEITREEILNREFHNVIKSKRPE